MTQADLKEICIHPATYAQALLDRSEAAERETADLRAQLAQVTAELDAARETCYYWLHDGRFLVANYKSDSEYHKAVDMLKRNAAQP